MSPVTQTSMHISGGPFWMQLRAIFDLAVGCFGHPHGSFWLTSRSGHFTSSTYSLYLGVTVYSADQEVTDNGPPVTCRLLQLPQHRDGSSHLFLYQLHPCQTVEVADLV